jgi:glucose/arabinose dehydrogenase
MPIIAGRASAAYGAGFAAVTTTAFAPIGAFDALSTVIVPSGGVASITFAGIPQTGYAHLQIRAMARGLTNVYANNGTSVTINNDTAANYSSHKLDGDGTLTYSVASANASSMSIGEVVGNGGLSNAHGVFVIDILDYTNTSKYKTIRTLIGQNQNTSGQGGNITFSSGSWRSTVSINRLDLTTGLSFAEFSHFALYGVK